MAKENFFEEKCKTNAVGQWNKIMNKNNNKNMNKMANLSFLTNAHTSFFSLDTY